MRFVVATIAVLTVTLVTGCARTFAPPPDDLATWQRAPIAPDPRLAALATETCATQDQNLPVQVVLQDRRTESSAAFLLASPGWTGSCLTTLNGGSSGSGWRSGPLDPTADPIVVDEQSTGGLGDGTVTMLGGRSAPGVTGVEIELGNGELVTASVGASHWLAWWPGGVVADVITATSADGPATVLAWRDGGWAIQ